MPSYFLPFKSGDKVLEVGGGNNPHFRPNLDCRKIPEVDIVADLNAPWPVESGIYNGAFGMYILEHISWRSVRQFVSELHRVLQPAGIAVMITANLLEQARKIVEAPVWDEGFSCMVFGDNDYPENTHRCGLSPQYATQLFGENGFHEVTTFEHPNCKTDMIIQARKSGAIITRSL